MRALHIVEPISAINVSGGKSVITRIPAGSTVQFSARCRAADAMVEVLWQGRTYALFKQDLEERSEGVEADSDA
jgi:hypothetical protein